MGTKFRDVVEWLTTKTEIRFLIVGGVCTLVQLVLFFVIVGLYDLTSNSTKTAAFIFSFTVSTQINFFLSAYLTWKVSPSTKRWATFNLMAVATGLLPGSITFLLSSIAIDYKEAGFAGAAIPVVLNYFISRFFIFRPTPEEQIPEVAVLVTVDIEEATVNALPETVI